MSMMLVADGFLHPEHRQRAQRKIPTPRNNNHQYQTRLSEHPLGVAATSNSDHKYLSRRDDLINNVGGLNLDPAYGPASSPRYDSVYVPASDHASDPTYSPGSGPALDPASGPASGQGYDQARGPAFPSDHAPATAPGSAQPGIEDCLLTFDESPVCGDDGTTYSNESAARCLGFVYQLHLSQV